MIDIKVVNDLPKTANYGDIVIISGSLDAYVYTDKWIALGTYDAYTSADTDGDIVETNCPNCGATIDRSLDKCPYCDTPYIRRRSQGGERQSGIYCYETGDFFSFERR